MSGFQPISNLSASTSLNFDIEYGCDGTGGGPQFSERATAPNAFTIGVTVLSALQASFVGSAIDFGEVGDKTDADVVAVPIIRTANIRVASSGVYSVNMTSAQNYRMTFGGGSPTNSQQSLGYQVTFVGQVREPDECHGDHPQLRARGRAAGERSVVADRGQAPRGRQDPHARFAV